MMQEDSNGDSTFVFVDKKSDDVSTSLETMPKTDSLSSLSSSASSLPPGSLASGSSLLSNIPPPSALPSFVSPPVEAVPTGPNPVVVQPPTLPPQAFHQTTFSPVIPPSKGIEGSPLPEPEVQGYGVEGGGGLLGWVKGAVGSGGLLSRVAEKAKNSVDSMITTLDPQMREFLHSGGDVDIVVASDKEVKVSPIREAFQAVFGKATVSGMSAQAPNIAAQPVGFPAAIKAAEERISSVRSSSKLHERQPVLAIENFLLEVSDEKWYDVGILMLSDPGRGITLQTFTQLTPVPAAIVGLAKEDTPSDYPLRWSGLAITIGSLMGSNLQVPHSEWHQALTGVSRREMLLVAAKVLAGLYKSSISSIL